VAVISSQLGTILALAAQTRPDAILAEFPRGNVSPDATAMVSASGYDLWWEHENAIDYGLPLERKRPFLVAIRRDLRPPFLSFPFPEHSPRADGKLVVRNKKFLRRLPVAEIKRIMGFPEDWHVPPGAAWAMALCESTCPPVAAAVAGEVMVWLSRQAN
jgi:site-specific DNA-cytosine methylase